MPPEEMPFLEPVADRRREQESCQQKSLLTQ